MQEFLKQVQVFSERHLQLDAYQFGEGRQPNIVPTIDREYLDLIVQQLERRKEDLEKLVSTNRPILDVHLWDLEFYAERAYDVMSVLYTAGLPVEDWLTIVHDSIKLIPIRYRIHQQFYGLFHQPLDWRKDYNNDYHHAELLFEEAVQYEQTMNLLSLTILLAPLDVVKMHTQLYKHIDKPMKLLINYFLDPSYHPFNRVDSKDGKVYVRYLYKENFVKALQARDNDTTLYYLDKHLTHWRSMYLLMYTGIDSYSHIDRDIEERFTQRGGWSFETALIVLKRNLDDSILRQHAYYPKDFVDYMRTQPTVE